MGGRWVTYQDPIDIHHDGHTLQHKPLKPLFFHPLMDNIESQICSSQKDQPPISAVAYVRMSTEHQQYSTQNQEDVIRKYAEERNIKILSVYSDGGKSGLNIQGREALQELIRTVESGKHQFTAVLVYDISRWGRFQDADESAHYEYLCKKAGVTIHYCAEQFDNDGSISSDLFKQVKRTMAGEYSRELSTKVSLGAKRLIELGYRQGGAAGYGLRRMLVDQHGHRKNILLRGEHKSIQTDRVILVPGPPEEIETVKWIYSQFLDNRRDEDEISRLLNQRNILSEYGGPWSRGMVHQILTNEKYIGNNVYNRTSFKLKQKHEVNPPEKWIRKDDAFEAIISKELFYKARGVIEARSRKISDDEIISRLKEACQQIGRLSGFIIDENPQLPSSSVVSNRFGGLLRAYRLVGYTPETDYRHIEENRRIREMHPQIIARIINDILAMGSQIEHNTDSGILLVNQMFTTSLVLSRCYQTRAGSNRWKIRLEQNLRPDFTIAARMTTDNQDIKDYYILPSLDISDSRILASEYNGIFLDAYRFDCLDYFYSLTESQHIDCIA